MKFKLNQGFTLIELLMVILLVAILSAIAIPQFVDFRTEARNAATRSALGALRTAVAIQYSQSLLRCGAAAGAWPYADSISANDATAGATPRCTTGQITSASERQFVASATLPTNPWGTNASVIACVAAGCTPCNANGCDNATAGGDLGWCYNIATGAIWADSAANGLGGGNTECNF